MAQSNGIDSIDRTVEKTYEWVRDLRGALGTDPRVSRGSRSSAACCKRCAIG